MARTPWINPRTGRPISGDYEKRLRRRGVRRGEYEAGKVSSRRLKAARGHAQTPERPQEAERRPERFERYQRRAKALRTMTDRGPYWIRGLRQQDRAKIGRHWNDVGKALDQGNGRSVRKYRNAYVGDYDDVEISSSGEENSYRPARRIPLASSFDQISTAVERDLPLSFEFIYEE